MLAAGQRHATGGYPLVHNDINDGCRQRRGFPVQTLQKVCLPCGPVAANLPRRGPFAPSSLSAACPDSSAAVSSSSKTLRCSLVHPDGPAPATRRDLRKLFNTSALQNFTNMSWNNRQWVEVRAQQHLRFRRSPHGSSFVLAARRAIGGRFEW